VSWCWAIDRLPGSNLGRTPEQTDPSAGSCASLPWVNGGIWGRGAERKTGHGRPRAFGSVSDSIAASDLFRAG